MARGDGIINRHEQVQNITLNAAWVSIFLVLIIVINFFGVKVWMILSIDRFEMARSTC